MAPIWLQDGAKFAQNAQEGYKMLRCAQETPNTTSREAQDIHKRDLESIQRLLWNASERPRAAMSKRAHQQPGWNPITQVREYRHIFNMLFDTCTFGSQRADLNLRIVWEPPDRGIPR